MNTFEERLAAEYADLPQVEVVALGGSRAGPFAEGSADYDLYVYSRMPVPVEERERIARGRTEHPETDNRFWEAGDEWVERTGERVDVMFRDVPWIEEQVERVLGRCEASIGYTTAFCFNVKNSRVLFDRGGWFARLQQSTRREYPELLRRNIVAKNWPILRGTQSSYVYQIERALERGDAVSVNHRVAALLSSFFDILFAVNRELHPGEKRLIPWAEKVCPVRPARMSVLVPEIARFSGNRDGALLTDLHALLDGLEQILREEKLVGV